MEEKEILLKTIEGLNASIASLSTTNKNQSEQIKNLQERIKELTAQVAWLNRQLFGRKSEKLRVYDPNMPDLFADEFSGLRQQAEEKRDEAVEKIEKESVEDVKRNRQNRKMIEDLPVLETDTIEPEGVDLSLYRRIGEEITKVVKHKPGMLYVKVIIRPKYALKDSTLLPPAGQKGVEIAPMPLMPVDKCIADTSLLAEILLQKYEYHVPFYRQIQQYRHLGMKGLTESTLDGWFKKTVELLKPLYEELKWEVFSCDYVQVDETTVPVINREKHKADKEYLWMVRSVMERLVIFHYDGGSRAGAVIESLANQYNFKGYLQCDGFAGYETAFKANPDVRLTVLEGYDCPADASGAALLLEDLCAALGGKTPYYLFLDDFHLLGDERVAQFLCRLAYCLPENVHLIVVSRNRFLPGEQVVRLGRRLHRIEADGLRLNREELLAYTRRCGVEITAAQAESLLRSCEGWFSAVYLNLHEIGRAHV